MEICKIAARRFVKVTDKEISEFKIISVQRKHKRLNGLKNTKTIIHQWPGDYCGIFLLKRKATPDFSKLKRKETREIDLLSFSIFQRIENISRLAG